MVREVARELAGRAIIVQVDTQKNGQVAARLGVRSVPIVFLMQNGKVLEQVAGVQTKSALLAMVARHIRA